MTNYAKGANKERMVKKVLEAAGMTCVRSSGSHGPVDLVAWNKDRIYFLQIKYNCRITDAELNALEAMQVPASGEVAVWEYVKGNTKPKIKRIK